MLMIAASLMLAQSVFVDAKRPGVYLTFERADTHHYYLRLHNNTRWKLWLDAFEDDAKDVDAGLFYKVAEDPLGYPPSSMPRGAVCHVDCDKPIASGTSWRFRVPKTHLGEGLVIQAYFEYEWELKQGRMPNAIPASHFVTISHSDLPAKFRQGERRRPVPDELVLGPGVEPEPPPVVKLKSN